jgi:hypothetical protein
MALESILPAAGKDPRSLVEGTVKNHRAMVIKRPRKVGARFIV